MIRPFWIACGGIALVLGTVGMFLPLLPTVPFLLLAAFCFARGSERVHRWLVDHDVLGPPIRDWQDRGAISRRAKWFATASIVAAFLLAAAFGVRPAILAIQVAVLACVAVFVWTRPEN